MGKFKHPICIDFDGVLAEYDGYKGEEALGKPLKGSKEFLKKLKFLDIEFNVFTTRPNEKIMKWLKRYKMPMPVKVTSTKEPAPVYIDDRVIKFDGDFNKLIKDMKNFKVYWGPKKIFEEYFKDL